MESKFKVGQTVYFLNGLTGKVETDVVYGVLYIPVLKEGKTGEPDFAAQIARGDYEVREQYQTLKHQIMDVGGLFASEEECLSHWRDFFSVK